MDTPKSRQPPYNGQTVRPLPIYCPYISTSEEGTTSKQWTKCSSPTCPLFGGSTVFKFKGGLMAVCGLDHSGSQPLLYKYIYTSYRIRGKFCVS